MLYVLADLRRLGGGLVLGAAGRGPSWPGQYEAAGTRFTYTQADQLRGESLTAPGPLTEPLELMVGNSTSNNTLEHAEKKSGKIDLGFFISFLFLLPFFPFFSFIFIFCLHS